MCLFYTGLMCQANVKTDLTVTEVLYIGKIKLKINAQSEFCHGTLSLFWHKLFIYFYSPLDVIVKVRLG